MKLDAGFAVNGPAISPVFMLCTALNTATISVQPWEHCFPLEHYDMTQVVTDVP